MVFPWSQLARTWRRRWDCCRDLSGCPGDLWGFTLLSLVPAWNWLVLKSHSYLSIIHIFAMSSHSKRHTKTWACQTLLLSLFLVHASLDSLIYPSIHPFIHSRVYCGHQGFVCLPPVSRLSRNVWLLYENNSGLDRGGAVRKAAEPQGFSEVCHLTSKEDGE